MANLLGTYNPNQSLLDQLQRVQIMQQQQQAEMGLRQMSTQTKGFGDIDALVRKYNDNPNSVKDAEVLYLQQVAPQLGYDISQGAKADRGGHVGSKAMGFGLGALDALLFDLIPDNAYVNRHNKGWSNAGKWASTIGALAYGGAGLLGAAKMGKLARAGKKVLGIADDVPGKLFGKFVSGNKDQIIKVLGKDAGEKLLGLTGQSGINKAISLVDEVDTGLTKSVEEIAKAAGVKKAKIDFKKPAGGSKFKGRLKGKSAKWGNKKTPSQLIKAREQNSLFNDPTKLRTKLEKKLEDLTTAPEKFATTQKVKITELDKKITDLDDILAEAKKSKRGSGYLKNSGVNKSDVLAWQQERTNLIAQKEKILSSITETPVGAKELSSFDKYRLKTVSKKIQLKKSIDELKVIEAQKTELGSLKKTFAEQFQGTTPKTVLAKVQDDINDLVDYGEYLTSSEKAVIEDSVLNLSKEDQLQLFKTAKETVRDDISKLLVERSDLSGKAKWHKPIKDLLSDASKTTSKLRSEQYLDIVKELTKKTRRLNTASKFTTLGQMRGGITELSGGWSGLKAGDKIRKALNAGWQIALPMQAARGTFAPTTMQDVASGPYGMLNGLFVPGMGQANLSALPFAGAMPPMMMPQQIGADQQMVQQMMQQ
jgi:hypothetical protein